MSGVVTSSAGEHAVPRERLTPTRRARPVAWRSPFGVHLASLIVGAGILAYANRRDWFFLDDWDFLLKRGFHHPFWGIWTPHNEHWSTLPILFYRAVVSIDGMHSFVPTLTAMLVAHLVVCHLLWRISLRCQVDPWIATALIAIFVVLGSGAQNITWDFQMAFTGSVAFGLGAMLSDRPHWSPTRRLLVGWALLICSLMTSGIGVTMTAAAGLDQGLRRGLRCALLTVSVPAAVYVVWFAFAGRTGLGYDEITLGTLLAVPTFVWSGLSSSLGSTIGLDPAGPVLVLVLLAWGIRNTSRQRTPQATALALGAAAVVMFLLIGITRTGDGITGSSVSRYTYLVVALLLPMIGLALGDLTRLAGKSGRLPLYGLLALVLAQNMGTLRTASQMAGAMDQQLKVQLLAGAKVIADGDRPLSEYVLNGFNDRARAFASVTTAELLQAERARQLPDMRLSPTQLVTAQSFLNVSLTRTPLFSGSLRVPPAPAGKACVTGGIFSVSVPRGGGSLVLSSPQAVTLGVTLAGDGGARASVVNFPFPAGKSAINISASNTTAVLQASALPGFTYCPRGAGR